MLSALSYAASACSSENSVLVVLLYPTKKIVDVTFFFGRTALQNFCQA